MTLFLLLTVGAVCLYALLVWFSIWTYQQDIRNIQPDEQHHSRT